MFPDELDEDEDLKNLVSWGLPGYSRRMAATKQAGSKGKSAAGKTAKHATTKTKSSKNK